MNNGMQKGAEGDSNAILAYNTFHMAVEAYPKLVVTDGFEGMEGRGTSQGTPTASRMAIASVDPLAANTLGAAMMGFNPKKILYLASMAEGGMGQGDIARMNILGDRPEECIHPFAPSPTLNFSAV